MANRLTRDQILLRALSMIDSPSLDQKDRPAGTIDANALSIGWLQDGLDYFVHRFPFGGTLTSDTLSFTAGTASYALPATFVQDYENGILLAGDQGRMRRKAFSALLDTITLTRGKPSLYAIVGSSVHVRPIPDKAYTATIWFYQLPAILQPGTVPVFPSDIVLVRYVYLRGMEWVRAVPPGTAEQYAISVIADLQKSGIGLEAEPTQIPFDRDAFPGSTGTSRDGWMGKPVL